MFSRPKLRQRHEKEICQYCGKKVRGMVLHMLHKHPQRYKEFKEYKIEQSDKRRAINNEYTAHSS